MCSCRRKRVMLGTSNTGRAAYGGQHMAIIRAAAAAVAVVGTAIGLAGPASADDRLDGDYAFTDGATTNTWNITTQCSPEGMCGGTVSGSTGMLVQIKKAVGGP